MSMSAFEKMQLREAAQGTTTRNEMIYNAKYIVDSLLPNDPSYKEDVEVFGKGRISLRMNKYRVLAGTTPVMNIQASLTEPVTFTLGDVFMYDGGYWICVESNNRHDVERTGMVEECNYLLRWQNPHTLVVHERWCSVRDPYSLAIDERARHVVTGNAKYSIKLPHDDETELFHVDRRFLIDMANHEPIPYSIIKYDAITNKYAARNEGFTVLTLRESQIEIDDNWELMIANYRDPSMAPSTPNVVEGSCTIKFNNVPVVRAGGTPKPFYAVLLDGNGNSIDFTSPVNWELILPPELQNQIVISYKEGNEIRLQASRQAPICSVFLLRMSGSHTTYGNFKAELEINIGGIL